MKRRTFIKTGIGVLGTAAVALTIPGFRETARMIILEDTRELEIKEELIDKFIADAENEEFWEEFSLSRKVLISVQYFILPTGIKLPYYNKYRESRNLITGQFLLSTNFFFHSTYRSGKEVQYIGFHNPYKSPCSHPFSSHHPNSKYMLKSPG